MNQDQMEGNWKMLSGKLKEQWGKLTDDDVQTMNGKMEQLVGKVQERYGMAREQAETAVHDWVKAMPSAHEAAHDLQHKLHVDSK
jgi:uncharacterized protein YjbJ (UPF0337 family)